MRKTPLLICLGFSLLLPAISQAQYTGPTSGQKVAFLGDSITAQGAAKPAGYVQLTAKALGQEGNEITVIPAGVSGNTSKNMLARVDADVIAKKPDWMTLSCGVNDVWHGVSGVPLDDYKKNITEIVSKAQAAGIKVIILTSTMIMEDQSTPFNQKLVEYNDFLRSLAKEKKLPLADLNAAMQTALAAEKAKLPQLKGNYLTVDGVHMNPIGDQMMATAILKAWGVTDAQIEEATRTWSGLGAASSFNVVPSLTVAQYAQLRALAANKGSSVDAMISDAAKNGIQTLLTTPPSDTPPPAAAPAPAPTTAPAPAKP